MTEKTDKLFVWRMLLDLHDPRFDFPVNTTGCTKAFPLFCIKLDSNMIRISPKRQWCVASEYLTLPIKCS